MTEVDILFRQMWRSLMLVVAVVLVGIVGFAIIGWGEYTLLDAIYMTVITLTTVGYGEIIDLTDRPAGRIFTILLLVGGVGSFLNFVSSLTAFWVEGYSQHFLWRRRMQRSLAQVSDHIIVCGAGHTGSHVVRELVATERPLALIEADPERAAALQVELGVEFPTVIGDATDDQALKDAGIERAATLVACVSNDKDNLIVTVSARILNPNLRIVSRCIDERVTQKIHAAGANAVVSPNRIGGLRIVSEAVRPVAVAYLDRMLRAKGQAIRVESTQVRPGSRLSTASVREVIEVPDLHLLAIQPGDGSDWVDHPEPTHRLAAGDQLVYTAGPDARRTLESLANS